MLSHRLNKVDLALQNLQQAINLDPQYKQMVKTDVDFNDIRDNARFIALLWVASHASKNFVCYKL